MTNVIVVGSVNADLVVSVAELPRAGETVTGGTFARHGGGKGANQAVAAARAGASVAMVGAVGADDLGDEALRELAAEGIDVSAVARLDGVPTGVAAIVVDARGENLVAVASGANAAIDAAVVEDAVPPGDGVVLLGHEIPEAAVVAGIRAGRAAGRRVVLNPAPARRLVDGLDGVLLTPNAHEARALTGEEDVEAAARALAARTAAVRRRCRATARARRRGRRHDRRRRRGQRRAGRRARRRAAAARGGAVRDGRRRPLHAGRGCAGGHAAPRRGACGAMTGTAGISPSHDVLAAL
jgi:sugar/nucleoside kinase (ribokinase family)